MVGNVASTTKPEVVEHCDGEVAAEDSVDAVVAEAVMESACGKPEVLKPKKVKSKKRKAEPALPLADHKAVVPPSLKRGKKVSDKRKQPKVKKRGLKKKEKESPSPSARGFVGGTTLPLSFATCC